MAKPKNLEQLRAEKEQVETQLAQEQHIVLSACGQRETLSRGSLRKGSRCDQSTGWLLGGQRLSGELVYWSFSGAGTAQCLRCQVRQVEYRRFAHSAGKVAVSCVCVHQKAIRHPAKTDAPPGCGERDLRYGRRARGRTDLPFGVPASRLQKALFPSVAVQHGGKRHPGGLCPPQTVN